jgi:predicted heme/steroid binding protein
MAMRHFKAEERIDFVNRATSPEEMEAIQKHLVSDCQKCAEHVALRRRGQNLTTAESAYHPLGQAVFEAAAMFDTARRAGRRNEKSRAIELVFDSFLSPVFSGARAASTGIRHMLYRADSFQIDLQIEPKPGHDYIIVTGQVLDVGRSEVFGSGLHITLSNGFGNLVHGLTNEFGEFHVEIENSDDLELALRRDPEKPIVITVKDPLGKLPGGDK